MSILGFIGRTAAVGRATRCFSKLRMTVPTHDMQIPLKLNFGLKPEEILKLTQSVLEFCVKELDRVGSQPAAQCTFNSTVWPLAQLETKMNTDLAAATFLQYVSTDQAVRDASVEATRLVDKYSIDKGTREDLFIATKHVAEDSEGMAQLDSESRRLVDKMMLGFKHNGLFLAAEQRQLLKDKRKRLAELAVQFSQNMNEDKTELLLTSEELEGVPDDFLEGRERRGDKYVLTMKYPDVFGVLKSAKREAVRKMMDIAFNSKCPQNGPLLAEAVQLRYECAQLLGYKNHAEAQLEESLAKTPKSVMKFEHDLRGRLKVLAQKELETLKALKEAEAGSSEFSSWDYHVSLTVAMVGTGSLIVSCSTTRVSSWSGTMPLIMKSSRNTIVSSR